ncbi:hypothetical protein F5H01DRAFT_382732 [Linnemannia elongata]|nr:hypothetical protein F5H01DRAFT_382732 [Linnemannia elongata]
MYSTLTFTVPSRSPMNQQDSQKQLRAALPLLSTNSQTWTLPRSESQPSLSTTTTAATTSFITSQKKQLGLHSWEGNNTVPYHNQQSAFFSPCPDAEQTPIPTPTEEAGTTSWMQDLDSDYELNYCINNNNNAMIDTDPATMTNQSTSQRRQQPLRQDSKSSNNHNNESRNNHHANIRLLSPRDPTSTSHTGSRGRRFFLPMSRSTSFLETRKFSLSNLFSSSSNNNQDTILLRDDKDDATTTATANDTNNNTKPTHSMFSLPSPPPDEGISCPSPLTKCQLFAVTAIAATHQPTSLPIPPTSLPLVRTQSIHLNRLQQPSHQQQTLTHPPPPPPLPPRHQHNDPHLLQITRSEPTAFSSLDSPMNTGTATANVTATTTATIRTSVDLSTLITVPTKVHIDHMGKDERSKILAALQLAIERAQAYRDELLQKDHALVTSGHATTTTTTHVAYQQKKESYQDYQNGYIDKDTNHMHQLHQQQQQQQQQQGNTNNQRHHYNDLHNNLHPHFQNHHYHPPLSPGPGMMATTGSSSPSAPSYSPHHHLPQAHSYHHGQGYQQKYQHPQHFQHFPYLSKCSCGCDPSSIHSTPPTLATTTAQHHPNHYHGSHSSSVPIPCSTIEMLLRASAQSTEARAVEEQRNMIRTKWAAILYTVISTLGILFACALDEKTSDRITFVVMYLLGLIVPIYALVDFGITRFQRSRKTTTNTSTTTTAVVTANATSNVTVTTNGIISGGDSAAASNAPHTDAKNLHGDEEAFHTGAFIHHI